MPEEEAQIVAAPEAPTPVQAPIPAVMPMATTTPQPQTAPAPAPMAEPESQTMVPEPEVKASLLKVITIPAIVIISLIAAVLIGYKLTSNDISVKNSIINYDNKKVETIVAPAKKAETETAVKKIGR